MANPAKDLRLFNEDLYINPATNDFDIALSDMQHVEDIVNSNKGAWKEFPLLGVGSKNYLAGSNFKELEKNIRLQLEYDGYRVFDVATTFKNDQLKFSINAERN